ncbi:MAG: MFS transporter [Alphaproteobacteria bacterium]
MNPATRFALIYAAQFAAFGVMMPFLPPLLLARGLTPADLGTVLAAGSALKLLAGPLGGRVADWLGDPRLVLICCTSAAAAFAAGFGLAAGFWALLLVNLALSAALAPTTALADAMALRAAREPPGFDYGRARAAGSASYILAAVLAGALVGVLGAGSAAWLIAAMLALGAAAAFLLPRAEGFGRGGASGFRAALALPWLRRLMLIAALMQGSHAAYYAFGSIHWQALGLSAGVIGLLWGWGVVAEVALFMWGRGLVDKLGVRGMILLAAGAGLIRWPIMAISESLLPLIFAQALHALTFGAMHLAAIRLLQERVPASLGGTAQTLLGAAVGAMTTLLTLASGPGYAALGAGIFWAMAGLCGLVAVLVAVGSLSRK